MKTGHVPRSKLIEVLQLSIKNNKVGIPTYLSSEKEEFVVSASHIEGSHGFPIDTALIVDKLYSVIESAKA